VCPEQYKNAISFTVPTLYFRARKGGRDEVERKREQKREGRHLEKPLVVVEPVAIKVVVKKEVVEEKKGASLTDSPELVALEGTCSHPYPPTHTHTQTNTHISISTTTQLHTHIHHIYVSKTTHTHTHACTGFMRLHICILSANGAK